MDAARGAPSRAASPEEDDLLARSTKKVKGGDHRFTNTSSLPVSYADLADLEEERDDTHEKRSYKETVLGVHAGGGDKGRPETEEFSEEQYSWESWKLEIVEKQRDGYECPEIVIPPCAAARLCRPWKQGLIVKLLGRRIGFKALENRLNQLWVKKGTMTIVDLGCEFFLVYLTCQEDHEKALANGPWMIYDHYLTVREWRPNFRPEEEAINRVTVWVRLPELPIEYYDHDFLDFLGNRIGRTVKVDKTTEQMARGKFARLCVEVDLDKPLLAMFEIKGHVYKIEYEGLHLLCMVCGKFGHYRDQCVAKSTTTTAPEGEQRHVTPENGTTTVRENGPWTVVQKQRWPRKGKDKGGPATNTVARGGSGVAPGDKGSTGSRFDILLNEDEQNSRDNNEVIMGDGTFHAPNNDEAPQFRYSVSKPKGRSEGTTAGPQATKNSSQKATATPKPASAPRASQETVQRQQQQLQPENVSSRAPPSFKPATFPPASGTSNLVQHTHAPDMREGDDNGLHPAMDHAMDRMEVGLQQPPRPPDKGHTAAVTTPSSPYSQPPPEENVENEEYMDAHEQGQSVSDGSDVEMVVETADL